MRGMRGWTSLALSWLVVLASGPIARGQEPALDASPQPQQAAGTEGNGGNKEEEVEVRVVATRANIPVSEISSSVTIIGREQIEQSGATDLLDVLRWVPGVQMVQTGGKGNFTTIFTRGAESDHTMFMIDGFQINSDGGTIDLGTLSLDNVERIEVIRGPGSSLWGSDAMAGVVNVVTRTGGAFKADGRERNLRATTDFLGGTYDAFSTRQGVEGGAGPVSGSIERSLYRRAGARFDNADFRQTIWAGNVGVKPYDKLSTRLIFRTRDHRLGNFGASGPPRFVATDPNDFISGDSYLVGGVIEHETESWWKQTLRIGKFKDSPRYVSPANTPGGYEYVNQSEFRRRTIDWQHTFTPWERNTLTAGFEWEDENSDSSSYSASGGFILSNGSDPTRRTLNRAYYIQDHAEVIDNLYLTAGMRLDDNSTFGTRPTYKAGAAYEQRWGWDLAGIDRTKLRANVGTGIKEPTLYERFVQNSAWSTFGNPDLDPERNFAWEVGLDQPILHGKAVLSYTFFRNTIKEMIIYEYGRNPSYFNGGKAVAQGHELGLSILPIDGLSINGNATFLDTEVKDADVPSASFMEGTRLVRRAPVTASLTVNWRPKLDSDVLDRFGFFVETLHVGKRADVSGGAPGVTPRVRDGAYTRADFGLTFKVTDNVKITGRYNNVFNKKYEEVFGFPADGPSFLGGVELSVDL